MAARRWSCPVTPLVTWSVLLLPLHLGACQESSAASFDRLLNDVSEQNIDVDSEGSEEEGPLRVTQGFICLLPAICDVGATTTSGIGLLYTTSSTFLLLKGSVM